MANTIFGGNQLGFGNLDPASVFTSAVGSQQTDPLAVARSWAGTGSGGGAAQQPVSDPYAWAKSWTGQGAVPTFNASAGAGTGGDAFTAARGWAGAGSGGGTGGFNSQQLMALMNLFMGGGGGAPSQAQIKTQQNWLPQGGSGATAGKTGPTAADQFLLSQMANQDYLKTFAQSGQPYDMTPMWQKMIEAQQSNIGRNAAQLNEQFNVSGGRFSTSFGDAAQNYYAQTTKDQDALLAQLQAGSYETAIQRQLQASGALAGYGFQGASQLSGQDFQSQMAQYNAGVQAAMLAAQGTNSASDIMGQLGYGASGSLLSNSSLAAQLMFGGANSGASQMNSAANSYLPQWLQYDQTLRGLGLNSASQLSQLGMQNLGLGNTLGTSQYGTLSSGINNAYQEWLRTQSIYNPLIPYLYQGATAYPTTGQQQSTSFWDYLTSILGGGLGALGAYLGKG